MIDRRATPRPTPERRSAQDAGPRERRAAARRPALAFAGMSVEMLDLRAIAAHRTEWAALAARAFEPNPFFEPAFLLPMLRRGSPSRQPSFIVVRRRVDGRMRIVGLAPVAPSRLRIALGPLRGWSHALAPLGTPLLAHDHAPEALRGLVAYASATRRGSLALALFALPRDGPVAGLLAAQEGARASRIINPRRHAALLAGSLAKAPPPATDGRGSPAFFLREGEAVLDALERFFVLEAAVARAVGAKALAADGEAMAAARAFTFALARDGRCVIGELCDAGGLVASVIVTLSGDSALCWRAAAVTRHADLGAQAQLPAFLGPALMARPGVARIDWCVEPGMFRPPPRWPDTVELADYLVASVRPSTRG